MNEPLPYNDQPMPAAAKLMAFYLSRDRVLSPVDTAKMPALHLQACKVSMSRWPRLC